MVLLAFSDDNADDRIETRKRWNRFHPKDAVSPTTTRDLSSKKPSMVFHSILALRDRDEGF